MSVPFGDFGPSASSAANTAPPLEGQAAYTDFAIAPPPAGETLHNPQKHTLTGEDGGDTSGNAPENYSSGTHTDTSSYGADSGAPAGSGYTGGASGVTTDTSYSGGETGAYTAAGGAGESTYNPATHTDTGSYGAESGAPAGSGVSGGDSGTSYSGGDSGATTGTKSSGGSSGFPQDSGASSAPTEMPGTGLGPDTAAAGPTGSTGGTQGDYVPDSSDPNVYTSPHGYSSTESQEPTSARKNTLPLTENVTNVPEGGVAMHGKEGLPEGKPNFVDRMVGKVQQEAGRVTNNWELHEKGVLRESGGAAAAKGEARAPI